MYFPNLMFRQLKLRIKDQMTEVTMQMELYGPLPGGGVFDVGGEPLLVETRVDVIQERLMGDHLISLISCLISLITVLRFVENT